MNPPPVLSRIHRRSRLIAPAATAIVVTTLLAAALVARAQTGLGHMISFDRSLNQAVVIPGFGNVAPTAEITIEFWQKVDSGASAQTTFNLESADATKVIQAHVPWIDGKVHWDFGSYNATSGRLSYTPVNIVGTWQHFAFVASQSGNYMKIFRNGVEEANKVGMTAFVRVNANLSLGSNFRWSWGGALDEFRVWSVARTAEAICADFRRPLTGTEPGLAAYWRFDETSGLTAADSSEHGRTGNLLNGPAWTQIVPGTAATLSASMLSAFRAQVFGQARPVGGYESRYWFQWGTTPAYDKATSPQSLPASAGNTNVSQILTNLAAGQTYHYRLVLSNELGVAVGLDRTFGQFYTATSLVVTSFTATAQQVRLTFRDFGFTTNLGYELFSTPTLEPGSEWTWHPQAQLINRGSGLWDAVATHPGAPAQFYRVLAYGSDRDGDGLLNALEGSPYQVTVTDASGNISMRMVNSDPRLLDTDGDGLTDFEERGFGLDPRNVDTDGDLISDWDEVKLYGSDPKKQDGDGDGLNNGLLGDFAEIFFHRTSPRLADTDGDARPDDVELIQNHTNPRVSDLPKPVILIDNDTVLIQLNVVYSDHMGMEGSHGATFSQGQASALSRSDTTATETSLESSLSVTVAAEAKAGVPPSTKVSASATATVTSGYVQQNSTTVDASHSQMAQQQYENYLTESFGRTEDTSSGSIGLSMKIRNGGNVAFKLTNLSISALRRNPANLASFQVVATLTPTVPELNLAPGQETGLFAVEKTGLSASLVKELLAQPSGLLFKVATFDLENDQGQNYAFLSEVNLLRTAAVTIDYGNGTVEKHRVATNTRLSPNGGAAGVTMRDVLGPDYLNLPYTTGTNCVTGRQVLTRVRNVETGLTTNGLAASRRFWFLAGAPNGLSPNPSLTDPEVEFDDIVLKPGDQIFLIYTADDDGDTLFTQEEYLYGTSDQSPDTDSDGISDFEEIRTGWMVRSEGPGQSLSGRQVFPNPILADSDGDGLTDLQERTRSLDPRNRDTDSDGLRDDVDPDPTHRASRPPVITGLLAADNSVNPDPRSIIFSASIVEPDPEDFLTNVVVNWGDGTSSANLTPAALRLRSFNLAMNPHTYPGPDIYPIAVTAIDSRGISATRSIDYSLQIPTNFNLLGQYMFTGNAKDTSGWNRHGTVDEPFLTELTSDRRGVQNRAYHFDSFGSLDGDYGSVKVHSPWKYETDQSYTLAAWVYKDPGGASLQTVIAQDGSPGLYVDNGAARLFFGFIRPEEGQDCCILRDTIQIPESTWVNYVVTVSRSGANATSTLYRNGSQVATTTRQALEPVPFAAPIGYIGVYQNDADTGFNGKLDNVRVYSRALTPADIVNLYNEVD